MAGNGYVKEVLLTTEWLADRLGAALIVVGLLVSSALLARVHDLRWLAFGGFAAAFLLGFYMVWKIIRTPGEL